MDLSARLVQLEQLVIEAKSMPLSSSVLVSREELLQMISEMQESIPEEIKQARWIVKDREDLLGKARAEGERIVEQAHEEQRRMAHEELMDIDAERLFELDEAPGAPEGPSARDVARDEDALHHGLQQQVGADGGVVRHPRKLRRETLERPHEWLLARRSGLAREIADVDRAQHQSLPASSVAPCSSYSSVSRGCSSWGASA